jgi:hypothetical protein
MSIRVVAALACVLFLGGTVHAQKASISARWLTNPALVFPARRRR